MGETHHVHGRLQIDQNQQKQFDLSYLKTNLKE